MVDLLDDEADKAYGAFPERLVIIQGGKVAYEGERGPEYYKPEVVREWLQAWKIKSSILTKSDTSRLF